ncbi:MAG: hypothetical protein KAQ70_01855, partial [Candidatus Heimdallarchaeota archaeon]|nr:hypothetical protein [Candidatus Heimdallarchaeota archaeon]
LVLCTAALLTYMLHPDATKYAMEAVKWSLQTCYFSYTLEPTSTARAVHHFMQNGYNNPLLVDLIELRKFYKPSFKFVKQSLKVIRELHNKTLRENQFPKNVG